MEITMEPGARGYVKSLADAGFPGFDKLLEIGEHFVGRTPIKSNDTTKAWNKREKPKSGLCFMNAQKFAIHHPEAKYYEGYWSGCGVVTVHHGWVVMNGKVYDFTAEACVRKIKRDTKRDAKGFNAETEDYFGIHIPTEYIHERIIKTEMWGDILRPYMIKTYHEEKS